MLGIGQELPKKPTADELRSLNQKYLMQVDIGMNKKEVVEVMGGMREVQTWTNKIRGQMTAWPIKYQLIMNPYSRDLLTDSEGNNIEVLWYYTDNSIGNSQDNDKIVKQDLTPIVLQNNSVCGLGWGYYTNYAKINKIDISIEKN